MGKEYIKFDCDWVKEASVISSDITQLNKWRQKLRKINLIGMLPNGIGVGNLSVRSLNNSKEFIITGSVTGGLEELTTKHYALVTNTSCEKNLEEAGNELLKYVNKNK